MSLLGQCYYATCRTRPGQRIARTALGALRWIGAGRETRLPIRALDLPPRQTQALMRLWSRMHWMGGDGMMPPDQLLAIFRLVATWPGSGDVVELGSWSGLTTCYLATACAALGHGHVYAVDTFIGSKEDGATYDAVARYGGSTWPAFKDRVRQARLHANITALVGDTVERAATYPGRAIRVLFIDADHSFAGVSRDFEAWWPHVAPGGLVVFHDYAMPEAGVRRFVDEIAVRREDVEPTPGRVHENVFALAKRLTIDCEACNGRA